jgi:hypothetical protein
MMANCFGTQEHPERPFPIIHGSAKSLHRCKVGSGSFRKIRDIVVPTGRDGSNA